MQNIKKRKNKLIETDTSRFIIFLPLNERTHPHAQYIVDIIVSMFKGCSHSRIGRPAPFLGRYKKDPQEHVCVIFCDVDLGVQEDVFKNIKIIYDEIIALGEEKPYITYCATCLLEHDKKKKEKKKKKKSNK